MDVNLSNKSHQVTANKIQQPSKR